MMHHSSECHQALLGCPMYMFFSVRWGALRHHSGAIPELSNPFDGCSVVVAPAG